MKQCPSCGYTAETFPDAKPLSIDFQGVGDKPCWRIKWGTLDTFWWGPESPIEAVDMMLRNWREWTPSLSERDIFHDQARLLANPVNGRLH